MDKYKRVEKEKKDEDATPAEPNEVRITQQGAVRSYVTYAHGLMQDKQEKTIVIKAMGYAISKAVTVAEVLKHRVVGLHQMTHIGSIETLDVYEPLEEGLDRVEQKRRLPSISITLSLDTLDTSDPGYQPPIAPELVTAQVDEKDLPEKPKRQPGKKTKKDRPKKPAAAAAAALSDRDEDKQESAEDTKESGAKPPPRGGNSSKRGGRGGRGRGAGGRGRGQGEGGDDDGKAAAGGDEHHEAGDAKDGDAAAAPKKRAPRKKPVGDDAADATKTAADRAAETTAADGDGNGENGGGRGGRGRSGRGRSRGRGRGRGDGGRGDGKLATEAAAAVEANA